MVKPKYRDGMLDGTPLDVAIRQVDEVSPSTWFARLREVKANASALSPDQMVTLDHVATGDPEAWADSRARLGWDAGIPVLGGGWGTNGRPLRALGGLLTW
jgi:hypothetical protein